MVESRGDVVGPVRTLLAIVAVLPPVAFALGAGFRLPESSQATPDLLLCGIDGAWAMAGALLAFLVDRQFRQRERERTAAAETMLDAMPVLLWVARVGPTREVVVNQAVREVFRPEEATANPLLEQCLATGRALRDRDLEVCSADGERRHLFGNAVPLRGDDGAAAGAVAAFVDVTAQHRAATRLRERLERLRRALGRAEAADRAQATFLASASHDLRQPFQAMRLYHQVLAIRVTEGPALDVLDKLGEAMTAGERLLNALLDVSRLDAGSVELRVDTVPLSTLLASLATQLAPVARDKGLRFKVCPTALTTRSDPVLLERILRNIVENALKYTGTGGVVVGCRRRGGTIQVQVWDSGIGIAPDQLERIFDDFYQIGNGERDRARGLGLGLGIVRRTAALLGHRITARSWLSRGSVFTIHLPLADTVTDCPVQLLPYR